MNYHDHKNIILPFKLLKSKCGLLLWIGSAVGDSLGCFKVVLRGFLCYGFSSGYYGFCHCCMGAKDFVWLARMLYHRADHTNAVIGGDNSQTTLPWGV